MPPAPILFRGRLGQAYLGFFLFRGSGPFQSNGATGPTVHIGCDLTTLVILSIVCFEL